MAPVATNDAEKKPEKSNGDIVVEKLKARAQASAQAPYNPFYSPHRDGDDGDDGYEYANYKVCSNTSLLWMMKYTLYMTAFLPESVMGASGANPSDGSGAFC